MRCMIEVASEIKLFCSVIREWYMNTVLLCAFILEKEKKRTKGKVNCISLSLFQFIELIDG